MRVREEGGLLVPAPDNAHEPAPAPEAGQPAKLMRVALMLRELQTEVRDVDLDEAGRERLREIHDRVMRSLTEVLPPELQRELAQLVIPFEQAVPSESEVRIAQAQLIGWLEGMFRGIQMAVFNQQLAAQRQLEQLRRSRVAGEEAPERAGGYL